jgi:hypothetical protein
MISKERHVLQWFRKEDTILDDEASEIKSNVSGKIGNDSGFGTALCFDKKGEKIYIGSSSGRVFIFDMTTKQVKTTTITSK